LLKRSFDSSLLIAARDRRADGVRAPLFRSVVLMRTGSMSACMLAVVAILAAGMGAGARQAADSPDREHDMPVPPAALRVLEIDPRDPLPLPRAIRVLHSVPRPDNPSAHVIELEQLLADLDRLRTPTARGESRLTLAMASAGGAERTALRESLRAAGLRLREQRGGYVIELEPGRDAAALRERLHKAGIDAEDAAARLAAGEALVLAPPVTPVPMLLSLDVWNSLLGERVTSDGLFATIVRDRRASLLYYGLQQSTPGTRSYLRTDQRFARWLYENAASAFAAFGSAFEVDANGHVQVPGGSEGVAVWEDLVGERIAPADRFGRALFGRDDGRLAYLYHTVAVLDGPRQRFALGLWMPDVRERRWEARQLAQAFVATDPQWSLTAVPFLRPAHDGAVLLATIAVSTDGLPTPPSSLPFWERALESEELPGPGSRDVRERRNDPSITAGWLAGLMAGRRAADRRGVLERLSFGQRLFTETPAEQLQDVLVAVRGFARYPAAMLALEAMGVRDPAVYAVVARHALALERVEDPRRAIPLLAQFQGALALLERLARTGAAGDGAAERLVTTLAAIPLIDRSYDGGIARWLREELLPALPPPADGALSADDRLLAALADHPAAARDFDWEGDSYRLDGRPAFDRLKAAHARQRSNSLDVVLALSAHVHALRHDEQTVEALHTRASAMRAETTALVEPRAWPEAPEAAPRARQAIERAAQDLARITQPRDTQRASRIGEQLVGVSDYLLAEVMLALAYAPALGHPEAMLGPQGDLAHRHTFGVSAHAIASTQPIRRVAWQRPSSGSRVAEGEALTGAVPGVETALARKQLRRLSTNQLPAAPRLNSNDVSAFVQTVALLNPARLDDAGLAQIARAVDAGRARVLRAARDRNIDALAIEARMTPDRRQWLVVRPPEPDAAESLFTLAELFLLGGGRTQEADAWGVSGEPVLGCRCLWFPPPALAGIFSGRSTTNAFGAFLVDLNLAIASHMAAVRAPAGLFPAVMSIAVQDFVDQVPARFDDDWVALSGHARALPRERVEDYVSAAIAQGGARLAATERVP
jgi:hypothetical protein